MKVSGIFLIMCLLPELISAQIVYDPTDIYDDAGGFYHHEHIYTLELEFYDPNYHAILKSLKQNHSDSTLPAKFHYGDYHFDSVAVRYKGNSTFVVPNEFNNPKLPYNIDLNDIVSGQQVERYRKLKLGNAFFDPTFARESMASFIYKQYLPTYETNLIRLVVNGNYLGVYVNQEDVGKQFLKKHFKENDGPFFKCEPLTEEEAGHPVDWPDLRWRGNDTLDYFESYERKSPQGWTEFLNFINLLNNDVANIESVLNVDRVLWNFAVTQVLSNEDTYNTTIIHNYYMYQTQDGKFQMLPWDLTESFSGILFTGGTPQSHYELDPLYGLTPYFDDRPLVYQLLGNSYYRKKYFAHIRTILNEYYNLTFIHDWVLDLQALAYDAVNTDPNKPHSMVKFSNNVTNPVSYLVIYQIAGILDMVQNRKPYLLSYPDINQIAPEISSVSQSIQHPGEGEQVYVSAMVSNANQVRLRITNNAAPYASDYLSIAMLDNGAGGDLLAGDGVFTAAVPFSASQDHIKYYIEAENANAMALMPERAEYFYYHYYVDEVVSASPEINNLISVYPNPAVDEVFIQSADDLIYDLNLYAINGTLVRSEKNLQGNTMLTVTDLPNGTYLLEFIGDKIRKTEKLMIHHD